MLYILHNFVFCGPKGRTYLSQPAGKRHPFLRPAFERPQWVHPAHTYLAMSPVAHLVGAGVPDGPFSVLRLRVAPASCMYASGGHISFNSERNMEKNAAKDPWSLDFLSSNCNCGAKRFRSESFVLPSPLSLPRTTLMVPCAIIVPASVHLWIPAYFDGRTLRRGRRPRRPASAHLRIPMHSRLYPSVGAGVPDGPHRRTFKYRRTFAYPSVGAGVPDGPFSVLRLRAAPVSCFSASGGHISFNSERNMEKNAAKNRRFLDFPFPIAIAAQKGSTVSRLYAYPRCRSRVPRENFLLSCCTVTQLYTPHNFYIPAAQRAAPTLAAAGGKCAI